MSPGGRTIRLPVRWIAVAAVLHLAAGAAFVALVTRPRPAVPDGPVRLVLPSELRSGVVPDRSSPGPVVPAGKETVVLLPAPERRRVPTGAPAPRTLRPPVTLTVRPDDAGLRIVRAFREGRAPEDSLAATPVALRAAALREATTQWNLAFAALIPEARAEMFLEALQDSPFPRR